MKPTYFPLICSLAFLTGISDFAGNDPVQHKIYGYFINKSDRPQLATLDILVFKVLWE